MELYVSATGLIASQGAGPIMFRGINDCAVYTHPDYELILASRFTEVRGLEVEVHLRIQRVIGLGSAAYLTGTSGLPRLRIRAAVIDKEVSGDVGCMQVERRRNCARRRRISMVDIVQVSPGRRTVLASA